MDHCSWFLNITNYPSTNGVKQKKNVQLILPAMTHTTQYALYKRIVPGNKVL